MTNIEVKAPYDYGTDITVQVGYEEEGEFVLDFCNHAGADTEEVDYGGLRYDRVGDLDWFDDMRPALVCDKCGEVIDIEPDEPDYERDEY